MVITIKDETLAGKLIREIDLEFATEQVTVKDIISERVLREVEDYNKKLPAFFNGLVEPSDAEKTINGYKLKPNARSTPKNRCTWPSMLSRKTAILYLSITCNPSRLTSACC